MKKLFLLSAIMMIAMSANAQVTFTEDESSQKQEEETGFRFEDNRKNVVSLGITAGGNYSMMSKYEPVDLGSRTGVGFQGGIALNMHFGQRRGADPGTGPIGLQIEALYAQHCMKTDLSADIKLGYLEIPVLLKYYITPNVNIELGPTFCYIMSKAPDELKGDATSFSIGELKGGDIKGTIGVSYQAKSGFYACARYNMGFSDLAKNFPCKVSAVSVSVGYLFNIFKF